MDEARLGEAHQRVREWVKRRSKAGHCSVLEMGVAVQDSMLGTERATCHRMVEGGTGLAGATDPVCTVPEDERTYKKFRTDTKIVPIAEGK